MQPQTIGMPKGCAIDENPAAIRLQSASDVGQPIKGTRTSQIAKVTIFIVRITVVREYPTKSHKICIIIPKKKI